ncbi:hypothetical protein PVAG01_02106 [Phlyctema vagabunda]|uniref:Dehydrin n=1 Tax=Phlyctema vagabunda TaxID=108571 RepID=A0ABR4PPV1_9HELO
MHLHPENKEPTYHVPDSIPTGKFKEPHHEKHHEGEEEAVPADEENVQGKAHEAGIEEVTEMKKDGNKQNEGLKSHEAGLEGQPHGGKV